MTVTVIRVIYYQTLTLVFACKIIYCKLIKVRLYIRYTCSVQVV